MLTIGGAAIGTFIMSNSMHDVKHTLAGFGKIVKGPRFRKDDYTSLLSLLSLNDLISHSLTHPMSS